jgi:hypothetical protein
MVCAGLGVFQDVTMRLIAERVVVPDAGGTTYVDRELGNQKLKTLPPPSAAYHVYCSEANPGAVELITELASERNLKLVLSQTRAPHRSSRRPSLTDESRQWVNKMLRRVTPDKDSALEATAKLSDLAKCDHMLLYLNAQTWTRGAASDVLANEVSLAMDGGVHLLLAHESTSSRLSPRPTTGVALTRTVSASHLCSARFGRTDVKARLFVRLLLLVPGGCDPCTPPTARRLLTNCFGSEGRYVA